MPGSTFTVPTVQTTRACGVVCLLRDLAERQRALRGGQERVAAHRDWRRSRMRRLADESQQVTLDAERADARRRSDLFIDFEHRALFDMQLEVRLGVDGLQELLRFVHARELDAVLAQRIDQRHAGLVDEVFDLADI